MSSRVKGMAVCMGLCLMLSMGASAQTVKIGVLDDDLLRRGFPQLEETLEKLQADLKAKQDAFDKQQEDLLRDKDKINSQKLLNPDDPSVRELEKKWVGDAQGLKEIMTSTNRELYRSRVEAIKPFLEHIKTAVERVAKANNFDLILKRDQVAYFSPAVDVTQLVVAELAKMGPVKKSSATAPKTPAGSNPSPRP